MLKANISKIELLQWLNNYVNIPISKVQQLGNGVGYLLILYNLHPDVVKVNKINLKAKLEYENANNLKLLVNYMAMLNIDKYIDIPKVAKMKYQDNWTLLQFFYKYAVQKQEYVRPKQNNRKIKIKAPSQIKYSPIKKTKIDEQNNKLPILQVKNHGKELLKIDLMKDIVRQKSSDEMKLDKIKKVLFGEFNSSKKVSVLPYNDDDDNCSTPILQSYRKFTIRQSILKKSKYLVNPTKILTNQDEQVLHQQDKENIEKFINQEVQNEETTSKQEKEQKVATPKKQSNFKGQQSNKSEQPTENEHSTKSSQPHITIQTPNDKSKGHRSSYLNSEQMLLSEDKL